MISMYTGSVGSGKSYHATELALEWLRDGKSVIANFDITIPEKKLKASKKKWADRRSRWSYMEEITVQHLMALSLEKGWYGKESQCLVVLDEAGIIFNSRDWQHEGNERKKWIKFLSQSRKFGFDFILVLQSDRMLDRQIRGLVEYDVKHLKANNSFMFKWLSMFRITVFMYIFKWYQTKLKGNVRLSLYKPWIANRYDTMKVFNLDELVESMKMVYNGKVVPAAVATQIAIWEDAIKEKLEKEEQERKLFTNV